MRVVVALLLLGLHGQGGNIDVRRGREMMQQMREALAGASITAEEAGKLFPIEWKK